MNQSIFPLKIKTSNNSRRSFSFLLVFALVLFVAGPAYAGGPGDCNSPQQMKANFRLPTETVKVGQQLAFEDQTQSEKPHHCIWDFGDGHGLHFECCNKVNTFYEPGTYQISLEVNSADWQDSDTVTKTLRVEE